MFVVLLCMGVGRSFPRGSLPHPTHIFTYRWTSPTSFNLW